VRISLNVCLTGVYRSEGVFRLNRAVTVGKLGSFWLRGAKHEPRLRACGEQQPCFALGERHAYRPRLAPRIAGPYRGIWPLVHSTAHSRVDKIGAGPTKGPQS
jgi:hypothetical protein